MPVVVIEPGLQLREPKGDSEGDAVRDAEGNAFCDSEGNALCDAEGNALCDAEGNAVIDPEQLGWRRCRHSRPPGYRVCS